MAHYVHRLKSIPSAGGKAMLAICEECSKKYNVDESKMKGDKARFSCQECGHIIVVTKEGTGAPGGEPSSRNSGGDIKRTTP